jgi:hypothetical protein
MSSHAYAGLKGACGRLPQGVPSWAPQLELEAPSTTARIRFGWSHGAVMLCALGRIRRSVEPAVDPYLTCTSSAFGQHRATSAFRRCGDVPYWRGPDVRPQVFLPDKSARHRRPGVGARPAAILSWPGAYPSNGSPGELSADDEGRLAAEGPATSGHRGRRPVARPVVAASL